MGANGDRSESDAVAAGEEEMPEAEGEAMMFRGSNYSLPRTIAALALWLGGIHFNVLLILASLFLFPLRLAALCVQFRSAPVLFQRFFFIFRLLERYALFVPLRGKRAFLFLRLFSS